MAFFRFTLQTLGAIEGSNPTPSTMHLISQPFGWLFYFTVGAVTAP